MSNRRQPSVLAGILVGGASARMGRPKQLLELAGSSFIERVAEALTGIASAVVLLGEGPVPGTLARLPRLPDPRGVAGPIAGLLAAMRWAPGSAWLIAACDQPLIRPEALAWLLAQRRPDRWAVLPATSARRVEPLLAVYEPQSRRLVEDSVAAGRLSVQALSAHPQVACPRPPRDLAHCWRSVDTPEEYRALQRSPAPAIPRAHGTFAGVSSPE